MNKILTRLSKQPIDNTKIKLKLVNNPTPFNSSKNKYEWHDQLRAEKIEKIWEDKKNKSITCKKLNLNKKELLDTPRKNKPPYRLRVLSNINDFPQNSSDNFNNSTNSNNIQINQMWERTMNSISNTRNALFEKNKPKSIYANSPTKKKYYNINSLISETKKLKEEKKKDSHFGKDKLNQITRLKGDTKQNTVTRYHVYTKPGENEHGQVKINQDSYIAITRGKYPVQVFGVFDGHGPWGERVSSFISQYLTSIYTGNDSNNSITGVTGAHKELQREIHNISFNNIHELYSNIHNNWILYSKHSRFSLDNSGSTCVLIFIVNNTLICANTGDSRAIWISNDTKNITIQQLNREHKPEEKDENERISKMGGIIKRAKNSINGGWRIFGMDNSSNSIATSRTIGDVLAKKIGVIYTPEIISVDLMNTKEGKCVVLASDGWWEVISNEKVGSIVMKYYKEKHAEKAVLEWGEYADRMWKANGVNVDDITIIVVYWDSYK